MLRFTQVALNMNELESIETFGFSPVAFLIQVSILLVLAAIAIRKAAKHTSGAATPLWILLVFLVPFFGAIATIACLKPRAS